MSIFDRLAHLMHDSVTVAPRSSESKGTPQFGSPVTYSPCQVFEGPVRYRDDKGDTLLGTGAVIVGPTPAVPADGKITISSGRTAPIARVERYPDATGVPFQRIILG